jgi:hypothetical protein
MRKKLSVVVCCVLFVALLGYNVYSIQTKYALSDLVLANIEAFADDEVDVADCVPDDRYSCEALHPTDSSKDQHRSNAVWK